MKSYCIPFRILFLLTCFAAFSATWAQQELPDIIERISPSVVVILTYDETGRVISQGSGFFVDNNGTVVTNHHVIEGGSRYEVRTSDGKTHKVSGILADDIDGDLALLSTDIPRASVYALEVSSVLPRVAESVIAIGCPLGFELTVSAGIVSAVREIEFLGRMIQIDASISPGSSGGPVVDMKGNVIGVAQLSAVEGQNLNFAIPGERVARLLSSTFAAIPKEQIPPPRREVGSAEDLYRQGRALVWAGNYEEALVEFEQVVARKPDHAEAWCGKGVVLGNLGRNTEALQAFEKAIQLKPHGANAWNNKGGALGNLGRYTEALEACEKAIQLKPDFAEAWYGKGLALGKLGRNTEALQACEKAIQLEPDFVEAWFAKGLALGKLGRYTEALEAREKAIQLKPDFAEAWYGKGLTLGNLGLNTEALQAFEKAIQLKPDFAEAWNNKGAALGNLGRYEEALQAYDKAIQLKPDFAEAWYNKGIAFYNLGRYAEALQAYDKAVQLKPD
ncbi:MAG: tetratricopeptide repeat protein [bacterium]